MSKKLNKWEKLIDRIKYLKDKKYYKNNIWSMAHWDSSAARGYAGGCSCCSAKHYNGRLENKRNTGENNNIYSNWKGNRITGKLCHKCIEKIEEIINYKFERR